jgi:hypothetical protein
MALSAVAPRSACGLVLPANSSPVVFLAGQNTSRCDTGRPKCPVPCRHQTVRLDLSQLTFADKAGADALCRLLRQGALRGDCSTFLSWLLDEREENRDE